MGRFGRFIFFFCLVFVVLREKKERRYFFFLHECERKDDVKERKILSSNLLIESLNPTQLVKERAMKSPYRKLVFLNFF